MAIFFGLAIALRAESAQSALKGGVRAVEFEQDGRESEVADPEKWELKI